MEVEVLKTDYIRREIKTGDNQGVVLSLDFYSVTTEQKNRIEEAVHTLLTPATIAEAIASSSELENPSEEKDVLARR